MLAVLDGAKASDFPDSPGLIIRPGLFWRWGEHTIPRIDSPLSALAGEHEHPIVANRLRYRPGLECINPPSTKIEVPLM